jgi:hypothetical protein
MKMSLRPVALIAGSLLLLGQPTISTAGWLDNLALRSSLDPKLAPRPAEAQVQIESGKEATALVSAGLKYRLSSTSTEWAPFAEWQRNTVAKAPVNVLKLGIVGQHQLHDIGPTGRSGSPLLLAQLNYKRDRIERSESFQAAVSATAIHRGFGKKASQGYRPSVLSETGVVAWRYLPYLGAEFEAKRGSAPTVRGVASLQTQVYPLPRLLDYNLQVTADYAYRRGSRPELGLGTRDHRLLQLAVNYFFIRKTLEGEPEAAAGVGYSYRDGSDPGGGLVKQTISTLAIKCQF